jgi:hypothetical protein
VYKVILFYIPEPGSKLGTLENDIAMKRHEEKLAALKAANAAVNNAPKRDALAEANSCNVENSSSPRPTEPGDTCAHPYHGFDWAIRQLRGGGKLARKGWNGKGMFVVLQKGYPDGIPINKNTAEATGIPEGTTIKFLPYLMMKTADGAFVPWLASQTDILAADWELAQGPIGTVGGVTQYKGNTYHGQTEAVPLADEAEAEAAPRDIRLADLYLHELGFRRTRPVTHGDVNATERRFASTERTYELLGDKCPKDMLFGWGYVSIATVSKFDHHRLSERTLKL